jgi:hypothetical protein
LTQAFNALQNGLPEGYASISRVSSAMSSVTVGATMTGAIVLLSVRLRSGSPALRHPGHWLLIVPAICAVCSVLSWALPLLVVRDTSLANTIRWPILGLIHFGSLLAYTFAIGRSGTLRWRAYFVALVVWNAVYGLFCGVVWLESMGRGNSLMGVHVVISPLYLSTCVWLALVGLIDLVSGQRRDWLHWTGVVTGVAAAGTTLLWWIGGWFLR